MTVRGYLVGELGAGLVCCLPLAALVIGVDEPDRPLGRIGLRYQIAQRIEDLLELVAGIATNRSTVAIIGNGGF